jgi:two-component system sensor histidine kinase HydH
MTHGLVARTFDVLPDAIERLEREAALRERVSAVGRLTAEIAREVGRLDRIVREGLEFARPVRVELAPVDVEALVWDAAGSILGGWEGPHVRLALDPDLGAIVTDASRLRGVLAKLLENAREAVRTAGRTAGVDGIQIGGRRVGGCRLLLWVEDRGAGVAAEDLPHVFEPFFTTRRAGTGLGLAIARKVVEALGGRIRMQSRPGKGTRVEIDLPLTPP